MPRKSEPAFLPHAAQLPLAPELACEAPLPFFVLLHRAFLFCICVYSVLAHVVATQRARSSGNRYGHGVVLLGSGCRGFDVHTTFHGGHTLDEAVVPDCVWHFAFSLYGAWTHTIVVFLHGTVVLPFTFACLA